ncbi:pyruvate formate lyase family protein [Diplocloster hominis]|uniref:pyruvate formate lyase family protein n=1 Tax=Diplocloster hominis TaxID=3079010 RepID=UPI0031BAD528
MNRMEKIKKRLFEVEYHTKKVWWGENETILTDPQICRKPLIVRKALAISHTLRHMPIELKEDELIVGIANMSSIGFGRVFTHYALPEELKEAALSGFDEHSVWGHHPPDYDKVLRLGLCGIRREVREYQARNLTDERKSAFYEAVLICLDSVAALAGRYAVLARQAADDAEDSNRRDELHHIADICSRVPENPAKTLQEALQSFWFVYISLQSTLEFVPIGRADQFLYPYYQADIRSGQLTSAKTDELICSWLAKFSERVQTNSADWENHMTDLAWSDGGSPEISMLYHPHTDESYNFGISANHWLANMILGGLDEHGNDAVNDLTYRILNWWNYLEVVAPVMSVRLNRHTPDRLFDTISDILRKGSSEPAIYNDEVIIPGLVEMGLPLKEARCYSNDGCWETLVPGKTNFSLVNLELLQLLEYVFFRGRSLVRGGQESIDTGDPLSFFDFRQFYQAFLEQMRYQMKKLLDNKLIYYKARSRISPSPLLSAMMEDCIPRGCDLTEGGCRYNEYCYVLTGLANCVDSLAAVKKLVYEDGVILMEDLIHALFTDFHGQEYLRQLLLNHAPKFGNDESYADDLAAQLLRDADQSLRGLKAHVTNHPFLLNLAIGTFENYGKYGYQVGASSDGRKAHDALSSNYSPALGVKLSGPTAVIHSITHPDLLPYATGCPLDLQINANEVAGQAGIKRMEGIIRSFLDLGGVILTVTGISEETLRDAQENPDSHRNLRVRLGGFSAYFTTLTREQQDVIIRRARL